MMRKLLYAATNDGCNELEDVQRVFSMVMSTTIILNTDTTPIKQRLMDRFEGILSKK